MQRFYYEGEKVPESMHVRKHLTKSHCYAEVDVNYR